MWHVHRTREDCLLKYAAAHQYVGPIKPAINIINLIILEDFNVWVDLNLPGPS